MQSSMLGLASINKRALHRPWAANSVFYSRERLLNLARYRNVPMETRASGMDFTSAHSLVHLPLLAITDSLDQTRNYVEWTQHAKKAAAACVFLKGANEEASLCEKLDLFKDPDGNIVTSEGFMAALNNFITQFGYCDDIVKPENWQEICERFKR